MKQKFYVLIMLFFIIIAGCAGMQTEPPKTLLTLVNCTPGTWLGGVKWNDETQTEYEILEELKFEGPGTLESMVAMGLYSITHYSPLVYIDNHLGLQTVPSAILDYRDVTVGKEPVLESFGCEE